MYNKCIHLIIRYIEYPQNYMKYEAIFQAK